MPRRNAFVCSAIGVTGYAPPLLPWLLDIGIDLSKVFPYDDCMKLLRNLLSGGSQPVVFDLDDADDEAGEPERLMESLLDPFYMTEVPSEGRNRIVEAHDDVARRLFSRCTPG